MALEWAPYGIRANAIAGSFITGQTVYVDGGFLAGGRWFTPDD